MLTYCVSLVSLRCSLVDFLKPKYMSYSITASIIVLTVSKSSSSWNYMLDAAALSSAIFSNSFPNKYYMLQKAAGAVIKAQGSLQLQRSRRRDFLPGSDFFLVLGPKTKLNLVEVYDNISSDVHVSMRWLQWFRW